jgi:Sortase family.
MLASQKTQVVAQAPMKDLKPEPKVTTVRKPIEKKTPKKERVTIDSFSPTCEKTKTAKSTKPPVAKKTVSQQTSKQSVREQSYTQQVQQQQQQYNQQSQYQSVPTHPVQSVQYHNYYYGQPAPMPHPVAQQQYSTARVSHQHPSQYQRAVMASQQQSQSPMPMSRQQYPMVATNGTVALPAIKSKKQSSVKPYTESMKRGVAKVKNKMNQPDMKYKPSDIMRYAVVTFFVIMASYLAFDTWSTNQQIQSAVGGNNAAATDGQHASSADVENPPMQGGVAYPDYRVADDMPRILTVPSLNLTARVSEVGLTSANKIDVPGDASFAGWYNGSAKLGDIGASFLTGHYNGVDAGGIFDSLNRIESGATITVEMGDGAKYNYEVINIENHPIAQVDMSKALSTSEGVVEGLNIMTCQGTWSGAGFSHRLTVYTRRV